MKRKLTNILTTLVLVFALAPTSYAAIPARPNTTTESVPVKTVTHKSFAERKVPQYLNHVIAMMFPDHAKKESAGDKSGWQGIVSLVCGIIGIFVLPIFFSTAAIVFGFLGLNSEKHQYTGLAIAGLILGGIGLIYALAVLAK